MSMYKQIELDLNINISQNEEKVQEFSYQKETLENERQRIEDSYIKLVEVTDRFNRKLVSYQGNKEESVHKWLKYKEGFSSMLVEELLNDFNISSKGIVLDPFSGSGTTSLTAQRMGFNSIAIDIMDIAKETFLVKNNILNFKLAELKELYSQIELLSLPESYKKFKYLNITEGAFSEKHESDLIYFQEWIKSLDCSNEAKQLLNFSLMSILEEISYTRKDGQYLRWDYRSKKVQITNKKRINRGKPPIKNVLDKGELPSVKGALLNVLSIIIGDIEEIQYSSPNIKTKHLFIHGSSLFELPKMETEIVDAVVTSPPYCNRYDYTRTYALELNFLGKTDDSLKKLRQQLISATVENKSKIIQLHEFYKNLGHEKRFSEIQNLVDNNSTLREIIKALEYRITTGEVNNKGIVRMVEGYFTELTFIYSELYRVLKKGAKIAIVNDNVRFAGEIIPVDFMSCEIAEKIGFKVEKIYCLKQKKGNSSQQMKKYGRVPLRKSITIWEKI